MLWIRVAIFFTILVAFTPHYSKSFNSLYICGTVTIDYSKVDAVLRNGTNQHGTFGDHYFWNLYKDQRTGKLLLNLTRTEEQYFEYCVVYVGNQKISGEAYPKCILMYEADLGKVGIELVNIVIGGTSQEEEARKYKTLITPFAENTKFRLTGVPALGDFFAYSPSGLGFGIGYVKQLRVEFVGNVPLLRGDTFDATVSLEMFSLTYECVEKDFSPDNPVLVGNVSITSSRLSSISLDMPCGYLEDLSVPNVKRPVESTILSFENMCDMFVQKNGDFEDVFWPVSNHVLFYFGPYEDRIKCSSLAASFLTVKTVEPMAVTLAYHDIIPDQKLCPPWLQGLPSQILMLSVNSVVMTDEFMDQIEKSFTSYAAPLVMILLKLDNVTWNTNKSFVPDARTSILFISLAENYTVASSIATRPVIDLTKFVTHEEHRTSSRISVTCPLSGPLYHLRFGNMSLLDNLIINGCGVESWNGFGALMQVFRVDSVPNIPNKVWDVVFPCCKQHMKEAERNSCCDHIDGLAFNDLQIRNISTFPYRSVSRKMFCSASKVDTLRLDYVGIYVLEEDALRDMDMLNDVSFSGNSIQRVPERLLKTGVILGTLVLSGNQISSYGGICENCTIEILDLSHNHLTEFSLRPFALAKCSLHHIVDVSFNFVERYHTDDFFMAYHLLEKGSKHNFTLLNLSYNRVTSVSFEMKSSSQPLSQALVPRPFHFDLSHNYLTSLGSLSFINLDFMSALNLSSNKISMEGESEAFVFLENCCNQFGCVVDLSNNNISRGSVEISKWFRNSSIRALDMSHNALDGFPYDVTNIPYRLPATPLDSWLGVALTDPENYYMSFMLKGNYISTVEQSVCLKSEDEGGHGASQSLLYDLSSNSISYISEDMYACENTVSKTKLLLNLNSNPLDCIDFPHRSSNSFLYLLSVVDTGVKRFQCSVEEGYLGIKSLDVGCSEDDPLNLSCIPECCGLTAFVNYGMKKVSLLNFDYSHLNMLANMSDALYTPGFGDSISCQTSKGGMKTLMTLAQFIHSGFQKECDEESLCTSLMCVKGGYENRVGEDVVYYRMVAVVSAFVCVYVFLVVSSALKDWNEVQHMQRNSRSNPGYIYLAGGNGSVLAENSMQHGLYRPPCSYGRGQGSRASKALYYSDPQDRLLYRLQGSNDRGGMVYGVCTPAIEDRRAETSSHIEWNRRTSPLSSSNDCRYINIPFTEESHYEDSSGSDMGYINQNIYRPSSIPFYDIRGYILKASDMYT